MKLDVRQPNKSLNKAYLKEKVSRDNIESFKTHLKTLLSKIDEKESEEHHKYPVSDFLKQTWYENQYEMNTKDHTDFVIHNGKTTNDTVGVIIEWNNYLISEIMNGGYTNDNPQKADFTNKIDHLIYKLYNLTEEQII